MRKETTRVGEALGVEGTDLVEGGEDPVVEGIALRELNHELAVHIIIEPVELTGQVLGNCEVLRGLRRSLDLTGGRRNGVPNIK